MPIVTSYRNEILKLFTGKAKSITLSSGGECYLGFSSTTPTEAGGNFTEPSSDTNYARIQLNIFAAMQHTDKWGDVTNGAVTNKAEICSNKCKQSGGWPEFTHFGIFTAKTGGTPVLYDFLTDSTGEQDPNTGKYPAKSLKVEEGNVAVFEAGTLMLSIV